MAGTRAKSRKGAEAEGGKAAAAASAPATPHQQTPKAEAGPKAGAGPHSTSSASNQTNRPRYQRPPKPTTAVGKLVAWVSERHLQFHMLLGTMAFDTWEQVYLILVFAAILALVLYGAYKQLHKLGEILGAYFGL